MFIAQSLLYYHDYKEEVELSDQIIVPLSLFHRLIREFENETVLYVNLIHTEYNLQHLVTITAAHDDNAQTIYVPDWILDLLGRSEQPIFRIEKADVSDLPVATNLIIKPLDPSAFDVDLTTYVEQAFMNLHSIQQNITIPIQVMDHTVYLYIEQVEPAPISRIVHGEVTVEFINMFEADENPVEEFMDEFKEEEVADEVADEADEVEAEAAEEEELTPEARRQQVRESWLKRFSL
jgi:hypothetical protein